MTTAFTPVRPDDAAEAQTGGSCPVLLLLGSALAWLLASGVLAVIGAVQAHSPGFLAGCPILSYGRVQALQETAFVYGWVANAGLGLAVWILGRLGGQPLRASVLVVAGTAFWNLGVTLGVIGIAAGEATALPFLQMPAHVQPILFVAYGAIGVAGVLAWMGRNRPVMYAAQWYAVAAIFLFPWIFSAAQVTLLWAPVRGVLQAVVEGWFAQSLWSLWMAPLALAGAYYVVPKITGRVTPGYDLAPLGFWCLLLVGAWTGGRHLIGGPAPVWISTVAIVTATVMLAHYLIVFLNLRGAWCAPAGGAAAGGAALKFIGFGLAAYVLGGFLDAITSMRAVALATEFTWFDEAQRQLALYGAVSMMLFGTLYFALPRLTGRPWARSSLRCAHLGLSVAGIVLLVVSLAGAGLVQGRDLNEASKSFAAIATDTRPWLAAAAAAQALLLFGNLLLAVNFLRTAGCCARIRATAEAFAS